MASPFNITPASITSDALFVRDLLTGFTNIDIVGVYNQETMQQVFSDGRPVKANIRETSRVMDHPVETGVTLSDHHIINPREIDIALVIPAGFYSSTYQQIASAQLNATLLSVQTKSGVYPNMIVRDLPHDETPEMFDVIALNLRLKEVIFIAPVSIAQPNAPADYSPSASNPDDFSVVNRGQQAPVAAQTQVINGFASSVIPR